MLIHVEANQFFPNSIQIIHDVQANQFFLDSIQIVQNGRERQDLLYTKGLRTRDDPQRYKTRSRPPYPDSSFPFFFRGLPRVISRNSAPWINTRRPNPPSNAPFPRHRSFRFPKLPPHRLRGVITRQPRAFSFPSPRNFPFSSMISSRWESRWGRTLLPVSGGIRISEVDLVWISRELWSNDNPVIL